MTKVNIKHYRGDTFDKTLSITGYTPSEEDTIIFCIRKDYDDEVPLVKKNVDPSTMRLLISSDETQNLPEEAVYDAQITYSDTDGVSYTKTFIYGTFKCTKDVAR